MFPQPAGSNIAFGTHNGLQHSAVLGFEQLSDLPANAFEWQVTGRREAFNFGGARQHHNGGAGEYLLSLTGLPLITNFVELHHLMVGQHMDIRVHGLMLT